MVFCRNTVNGQTIEGALDSIVEKLNTKLNLQSAIAIGVIKNNNIIFEKTYGYANVPQNIEASAETPFYIASTTKSYLCVLAIILEKENKLNLDEPIARYLLGFEFKDTNLSATKITTRDLLTHQAGLKSEAIIVRTSFTGESAKNADELLKLFEHCQFIGADFAYSNLGYILAGIIFEKVSGKSWQDLLKEKIFDPMEMNLTSASVWHLYSKMKIHPALGHTISDGKTVIGSLQKADANMHAGGGIFSSLKDSEKWLMLHMNNGKINKLGLVANDFEQIHQLQAYPKSNFYTYKRYGYDMGWYHGTYEGDTLIHCFGSFPGGYRAHTSYMPNKQIGIAVFANAFPEAVFIPDIIANFIYDKLLGKKNLSEKYDKLIENYTEIVQKFKPEHSEINQSALTNYSHPDKELLGTYYNSNWGTVNITSERNKLYLKWGTDALVKSELIPYETSKYKLALTELFSPSDYVEIYMSKNTGSPILFMKKGQDEFVYEKKN